ncbi:MAG: hypothetical protein EOO96_24615, partial [Pedobacter sp.]
MQKRFLTLLFVVLVSQLNAQTVKLQGVIKNPSDSIITLTRSSTPVLSLEQNDKTYVAKLDNKGRFNISLPESSINEWMLAHGDDEAYFYLRTGQEIFLTVDFGGEYYVRAKGKFADEVNYLEYEESELSKRNNSKAGSLQQIPKSFEEDLKSKQDAASIQQEILNSYKLKFKISDDFYKWLTAYYEYYPAKNISIEKRGSMNDESMALLIGNGFNDDYAALNSSSYLQLAENYVNYKLVGTKNKIFVGDYLEFVSKSNQINAKT